MDMGRRRIEWADCAKGIGILLVIMGHTVEGSSGFRGGIFSFHMPLFFIMSSMTYQYSSGRDELIHKTQKAFRHLVIPALCICLLRTMGEVVKNIFFVDQSGMWGQFFLDKALMLLFASGVKVNAGKFEVSAMGMPWFMIVLFLGRTLFDAIHIKIQGKGFLLICIVLSALGVAFGQIQFLPFSFDIALAVMFFFYVGQLFKNINIENRAIGKVILSAAIWMITLLAEILIRGTYMELAGRRYPLFPLCYFTAIAGTLFVSEISFWLWKMIRMTKWLCYLGRNSLYMFFVHAMDYLWRVLYTNIDNVILKVMVRVLSDVAAFLVMMSLINVVQKRLKQVGKK